MEYNLSDMNVVILRTGTQWTMQIQFCARQYSNAATVTLSWLTWQELV